MLPILAYQGTAHRFRPFAYQLRRGKVAQVAHDGINDRKHGRSLTGPLPGGNIAFISSKEAHRPCIEKIGAAARGREHSRSTIETIKTLGSVSLVGFGGFDGSSRPSVSSRGTPILKSIMGVLPAWSMRVDDEVFAQLLRAVPMKAKPEEAPPENTWNGQALHAVKALFRHFVRLHERMSARVCAQHLGNRVLALRLGFLREPFALALLV
jgi:hypothetical protein